jgi:hypothetical protein
MQSLTSPPEFVPWPKIPRLFKTMVITEKIDGTNACVVIDKSGDIWCQSRTRYITPDDDHHGFAKWAYNNSKGLYETLGPGRHFGEWWGRGINRGYGCQKEERYFSLFNTKKWSYLYNESPVDGLTSVPILYTGDFDTATVFNYADFLTTNGSFAKPGYMRPEGVCIFHEAAGKIFKYPFDKYSEMAGY